MEWESTSDWTKAFRRGFTRQEGVIPLNAAAMAPLNGHAKAAMSHIFEALSWPDLSIRQRLVDEYQGAHRIFAELLDCQSDEVTFMPNVASAMSSIAHALDLKPEDEIVTIDQEYGSNAYPWHEVATKLGAKVLSAVSRADFTIDTDAVIALISPRTRVVTVSWVQFQTGTTIDLNRIRIACQQHGALLVVDTTQGVGVAPFSMKNSGVDIIAGSTHKWLCGPPGQAYLAIKKSLIKDLKPPIVGPYSYGMPAPKFESDAELLPLASRFQSGTPSLISIIGAAAAAKALLEVGVRQISERALRLAHQLREGLLMHGHEVQSPLAMTSPIVTFKPQEGIDKATQSLSTSGVSFSIRGGGVRLSPHAFNTERDIETVLNALGRSCRI